MAGHVGTKSRTVSKEQVANSLIPALGFTKILWKHEASAGDRKIDLTGLTAPTSSVANGYVAPQASILSQINLQQFKENITLKSGAGEWVLYDDFLITGAGQITLLRDAEEGEIFTGVIDFEARTGTPLADATPFSVSGTLAANTTDFNVGQVFETGKYLSSQHGAVLVFADGQLLHRNTNNNPSGVGVDGDYYEVHAGAGLGQIIRFNSSDTEGRQISVVSNGALVEKPSGTHTQLLEAMQGQLNVVTERVEVIDGVAPGTFTSIPATADLKAFGDRVFQNEEDIDDLELGGYFIGIRKSGSQASINGDIQITGLSADTNSGMAFASDTVTVPNDGSYTIDGAVDCDIQDGDVQVAYSINGGALEDFIKMAGQSATSKTIGFAGHRSLTLSAGDEITFHLSAALVRTCSDFRFSVTWKGDR